MQYDVLSLSIVIRHPERRCMLKTHETTHLLVHGLKLNLEKVILVGNKDFFNRSRRIANHLPSQVSPVQPPVQKH